MSKFYETFAADPKFTKPRQMHGMVAQQIVEYMQKHHRVNIDPVTGKHTPANKSTAYLEAVASAIFDPADWKNPIYAKFPKCGQEWAKAAIIWYHGRKPLQSYAGVYSRGYAC